MTWSAISRAVLIALLVPFWGQTAGPLTRTPTAVAPAATRIVSIVPAVTEMLFAMGAGPSVVGVSSFDRHPPEVERVARVGALVDPDVERVLALQPDLVIVYETQTELREQLRRAGIPCYAYVHGDLPSITTTIRDLGHRLDISTAAEALASDLEARLAAVADRVRDRDRPRTMLVFDRQPGSLTGIVASGGVGFLHDMLVIAGGTNLFSDVDRQSLQVNTETLLARGPDVIVELRYNTELSPREIDDERRSWDKLPTLPAVRTGRVHVLSGNEFVVPGPRIAEATERLARALHPDAFE